MILYSIESYSNTRNDGKIFYHETKELAQLASAQNKEDYDSIAALQTFNILRCDPCRETGKIEAAFQPHRINGKDHCPNCYKEAMKKL